MKAAKDMVSLAQELESRRARKRDYIIDNREMTVLTSPGGVTELSLRPNGQTLAELAPQNLFMRQLGQHIGVRADLVDRLQGEHPMLLDGLVNGLLGRLDIERGKAQSSLIRTYAGEDGEPGVARALLGPGYRTIDNEDVAEAALPVILEEIPGAVVEQCELTDTKMYIKVLVPTMGVDLRELVGNRGYDGGEDRGQHYGLRGPDVVQAGFVLTNSEVGAASLSIEHMLFRVACKNGMIVSKALSRRHVGKRQVAGEDYTIYSDATIRKDDEALMAKVADAVRHTVNEEKFRELATQFAETMTTEPIRRPIEAMKVIGPKVGLTDGEGQSVLEKLMAGGDKTQFGLINAVTAAAQEVDSYDRSVEMEAIGAQVMNLSGAEWGELVAA